MSDIRSYRLVGDQYRQPDNIEVDPSSISSSNEGLEVRVSALTRKMGKTQGDNYRIITGEGYALLIVADGAGSVAEPYTASALACEYFGEGVQRLIEEKGTKLEKEDFVACLDCASIAIRNKARELNQGKDKPRAMGTTLSAVYITEKGEQWVSVGDSPGYIFDTSEGERLQLLGQGHNVTYTINDENGKPRIITSNTLAYYLGTPIINDKVRYDSNPFSSEDVVYNTSRLERDRAIILCSDGLRVDEEDMIGIVQDHDDPTTVINELYATHANQKSDNATTIYARVLRGQKREVKPRWSIARVVASLGGTLGLGR